MKLLIGGDLVPTESNISLFENAESEKLLGDSLFALLSSVDYRVFNLEVPLTDVTAPIDKCGPNLIAPSATAAGIKAIGVDLVVLANNHIMDQSEQGLFSTIQTLQENKIAYVGAGENLQMAQKPFILEQDGRRIGVYACAEHEFSIADKNTPGANPFDPLESLDHIAELKQQTDYVVVFYHNGKEYYRYPTPKLQKVCRKMVEKGADLVVCQHSHCVGSKEQWQDGTIVYGQGNFLFDRYDNEFFRTGLLLELTVNDDIMLTYHPLEKHGNTVRLAKDEKAEEILSAFYNRSTEIQEDGFLERRFRAFSEEMLWNYLGAFHGNRTKKLWFRVINKLSGHRFAKWYLNRQYDKQSILKIQNYVECEAHREVLEDGLRNNAIKNKSDVTVSK